MDSVRCLVRGKLIVQGCQVYADVQPIRLHFRAGADRLRPSERRPFSNEPSARQAPRADGPRVCVDDQWSLQFATGEFLSSF